MAENASSFTPTASLTFQLIFKGFSSHLKRTFDVIVSALGLLALSPLFALIAILIKQEGPGPVFYRGPRAARGGQVFGILKFRTMREEQASYAGPRVTAQDDPRVTPLGRWLRHTKLNELPQLWNVLVGEMSLVGPRPEDPEIAGGWPIDVRLEVLSVRPGITSPASVLYRNEENLLKTGNVMSTYLEDVLPSKLRLDQLYVRHHGFLLDLDILLWTALVLLPRLGDYQPPEESLFWGPVAQLGRRYLNWFVVDTLVTFIAVAISGFVWREISPLKIGWEHAILESIGFAFLFSITGAVLGIHRIAWSRAAAMDALELLPPILLPTLLCIGIRSFDLYRPMMPSRVVLLAAFLALGGYVAVRYRARLVTGFASRWLGNSHRLQTVGEHVLIVGGGEGGQLVSWMLHNSQAGRHFYVSGFVDDDMYKQGIQINGVRVLGRGADLPQLVTKHDIGMIVFAIHNIAACKRRDLLKNCQASGARVVMIPDLVAALKASPAMSPSGGEKETVPAWQEGKLACQLCLTRTSPIEVEGLLADLAQLAECGDLLAIKERIRFARQGILVTDPYEMEAPKVFQDN